MLDVSMPEKPMLNVANVGVEKKRKFPEEKILSRQAKEGNNTVEYIGECMKKPY